MVLQRPSKKSEMSQVSDLNSFLPEIANFSLGFRFQIDFSKGESEMPLKRLFAESGLTGMLEALDFSKVDQVSPFHGSVVDVLCGNEDNADVTQYLHCMLTWSAFYSGVGLNHSWATKLYLNLKTKLKYSNEKRWRCFRTMKRQDWAHRNWHMLNHISESIREVDTVKYLHAGIFQSGHRIFKRQYRKRLLNRKFALEETLCRIITGSNVHSLEEQNQRRRSRDLQEVLASRAAHN